MPTIWTLTDQHTLSAPGATFLVFHDIYPEGHQGGLELILHGERLITNGDFRLDATPGQWDALPEVGQRSITEQDQVQISLQFHSPPLVYTLRVWSEGESLFIVADLAHPLPEELEGVLGFNLELYPPAFISRSYSLGRYFGIFPLQPNGPLVKGTDGRLQPFPLAHGSKFVAASEDPAVHLEIESFNGELQLYDGRDAAVNGWFVIRAPVKAGASAGAISLKLTPHRIPGWTRPPVLLISQVGYSLHAEKRLLVELDPTAQSIGQVILERIQPDGNILPVLSGFITPLNRFLCYDYGLFDFTCVQTPGLYQIRLGNQVTPPFPIAEDVYQRGVWQPTLETHLPVQMCHMCILDGGRIWHGACHLDDARQAPLNTNHFDSYRQSGTTETHFTPLEHIPHLDRGGWHDAGDFDLAAGSQAMTIWILALAYQEFGITSDQTTVLTDQRLVILHQPDGIPDLVQQVAHGVENLLSGYHATRTADDPGHSFIGIIEPTLYHYTLLGDTASMTDNRIDNPKPPVEGAGVLPNRSYDDRWAFTNRNTALEYLVVTALAAASRVLREWYVELAAEALTTALAVWDKEHRLPPVDEPNCYVPRHSAIQEIIAAVELLLTTHEPRFGDQLKAGWPVIQSYPGELGWTLGRVLPELNDPVFAANLYQRIQDFQRELQADLASNPFGVPFHPQVWGVGWDIQQHGVQAYYLQRAFPDLFKRESVTRALDYVLGIHPGSSTSLVSGVGAQSLIVAYGQNRADWSYIPGGVASGPNLVRPNFPELKQPFPFLWQQSEYVISGAATYLFLVFAADQFERAR